MTTTTPLRSPAVAGGDSLVVGAAVSKDADTWAGSRERGPDVLPELCWYPGSDVARGQD